MQVIEGKIENIKVIRKKRNRVKGVGSRAFRIRNMNFYDLIGIGNLEIDNGYEENLNTYLYDQQITTKSENYRTEISPDSPMAEQNRSFLKNSQVLPVDFET